MIFRIRNKAIENELEDCRNEYDTLSSDIYFMKEDIEDLKWKTENLKNKQTELEQEIVQIKADIAESERKLKLLNTTLPEKNKKFNIVEERLEQKELLFENTLKSDFKNYVLSLKENQCYSVCLDPSIKTVDLLDKYCSSGKEFLLLKKFCFFSNKSVPGLTNITLIIAPYYSNIKAEDTEPTMTELKRASGQYLYRLIPSDVTAYKRLQPLLLEIHKINKTQIFHNNEIFPFNTPFLIGGQTSRNRTGYGCEWIGGGDYIEGTLYGEVTDFMAVGFIVNIW